MAQAESSETRVDLGDQVIGALVAGADRASAMGVSGLATKPITTVGGHDVVGLVDAEHGNAGVAVNLGEHSSVTAGALMGRVGDIGAASRLPGIASGTNSDTMVLGPALGVAGQSRVSIGSHPVDLNGQAGLSMRGPFAEATMSTNFTAGSSTQIYVAGAVSGGMDRGAGFTRGDVTADIHGPINDTFGYSASFHATAQTPVQGRPAAILAGSLGIDAKLGHDLSAIANATFRGDTNGHRTINLDAGPAYAMGDNQRVQAYGGVEIATRDGHTTSSPAFGVRFQRNF